MPNNISELYFNTVKEFSVKTVALINKLKSNTAFCEVISKLPAIDNITK
jgi:hypothetical protein